MDTLRLRMKSTTQIDGVADEKHVELELGGITEVETQSVINGIFAFMHASDRVNDNSREQVIDEETLERVVKAFDPDYETSAPPVVALLAKTEEKEQAHRPRELPKVNEHRTLTVPLSENAALVKLAEDLKTEPLQPEALETGILYKNYKGFDEPVPTYRVGYTCPKCGNTGRRYAPEWFKYITCHQCATPLDIRLAVSGKPLERDANGNFFIADTEHVQVMVGKRN